MYNLVDIDQRHSELKNAPDNSSAFFYSSIIDAEL